MRATVLYAAGDVRVETVPDPQLRHPTDALVRVTHSCVCGSDLWPYRSWPASNGAHRMGHEFIGVVQDSGAQVATVKPGDRVIAPFMYSDNTCPHCARGVHTSCVNGGNYGTVQQDGAVVDGGQGEYVRVPQADGTLVAVPGSLDGDGFDKLSPALLALSDVMGTGHHAALGAGVAPGSTVAVVGDGAVGLCGVLAARRLGAERVILLGRSEPRWRVAQRFGATERVTERGAQQAAAAARELTGGLGADGVLECVGTREAFDTAITAARPGARVGFVGVPQDLTDGYAPLPIRPMFSRNVALHGGVAPVRAYLPALLGDVLSGDLDPSPVFDLELPLEAAPEAYRAMNDRTAIKVLLRP
ncbi:MAG: zinc-dependent alcohol dehydrogenase family protein [Actinocrinis sp.]